ncbi:MAG: hypothetical protein ABI591_33840 [Kofleriaceae bacterium]
MGDEREQRIEIDRVVIARGVAYAKAAQASRDPIVEPETMPGARVPMDLRPFTQEGFVLGEPDRERSIRTTASLELVDQQHRLRDRLNERGHRLSELVAHEPILDLGKRDGHRIGEAHALKLAETRELSRQRIERRDDIAIARLTVRDRVDIPDERLVADQRTSAIGILLECWDRGVEPITEPVSDPRGPLDESGPNEGRVAVGRRRIRRVTGDQRLGKRSLDLWTLLIVSKPRVGRGSLERDGVSTLERNDRCRGGGTITGSEGQSQRTSRKEPHRTSRALAQLRSAQRSSQTGLRGVYVIG